MISSATARASSMAAASSRAGGPFWASQARAAMSQSPYHDLYTGGKTPGDQALTQEQLVAKSRTITPAKSWRIRSMTTFTRIARPICRRSISRSSSSRWGRARTEVIQSGRLCRCLLAGEMAEDPKRLLHPHLLPAAECRDDEAVSRPLPRGHRQSLGETAEGEGSITRPRRHGEAAASGDRLADPQHAMDEAPSRCRQETLGRQAHERGCKRLLSRAQRRRDPRDRAAAARHRAGRF